MDNLKQKFLKYWLLGSALALAILYAMFDRRGRELDKVHADAQAALLAKQLADIREQSHRSSDDYKQARQRYIDLRQRHGELMDKLGLGGTAISRKNN